MRLLAKLPLMAELHCWDPSSAALVEHLLGTAAAAQPSAVAGCGGWR